MTVPEENRPKTRTTDEVVTEKSAAAEKSATDTEQGRNEAQAERRPSGSTMREALDDAGVKPEDYEK
ncbi:hypothetical protein GLX30_02110 [Streptomyces sp. Tu 2975]|uniref:hypothetical protein n=1 Tax=Streptomyces sp. Tu 2975 TaxID=2676871 RepID=UPI001357189F|nr:hypothetical protein [Streptomyces sp. Tu 2975]QIP83078.1 hypothetical protein GLX30_02110 [Streptomyces sp. Tu 2975]